MADKADTTVFVEPATARTFAKWTPQMIKSARLMADGGSLELAADFCEQAMGDDRVQAALATRTNGFLSLPLTFEKVRGNARQVRALEADEDWWNAFPSTALAQLLAWGILLGIGLGQIVWTQQSSVERIIPSLKIWHPRHLRYDWQRRTWTVRTAEGKAIDVTPGDGKWILYMPYGESRPWSRGAWRAISQWVLLKQYAIEDWGYYSGKNAGGYDVVESSEEKASKKEVRKEIADQLFALQANGAIVLPPGMTLKKVEATANTFQTFQEQKNAADVGMSVAIVGQNLSTEVAGPVATGATLHGKVLQVFIDADGETLPTCIHDQALTWWAEFNFGNRDLAPWPVYDTKPPEDRKACAEVEKTRSDTAKSLAAIGVFTVNEVRVAAGYEELKEGGDELVKVTPPAPAPPDPNADPNAEGNAPPPPKKSVGSDIEDVIVRAMHALASEFGGAAP